MAVCAASPRPARLLSVVLTGTLAWAAGGCTGGDPPTGSASPPVSASPAADRVASPAGLPATVQEYAEAAVAAWASVDLIRLAELTTVEVHEQIVELPGPPDLRWRFVACLAGGAGTAAGAEPTGPAGDGADPATSTCTFHNTDGDELGLAVAHELLNRPRAVVAMEFEATTYPEQPQAYVDAFIQAWRDGNQPRMDRLALAGVTAAFADLPHPAGVDYRAGGTDDRLVTVLVELTPAAPEAEAEEDGATPAIDVETRLSTALLGQPQAIRQVSVAPQT